MKGVASSRWDNMPAIAEYSYPGGTLHLATWAFCVAGVVLILLVIREGGLEILLTTKGLGWFVFGFFGIATGVLGEFTLRNRPGTMVVTQDGLDCSLPWGRRRFFRWAEIREVRCTERRFHHDIAFWVIQGTERSQRVEFHWELKDYKDLLRTIQQRATNCQRFDPID